MVEGVKSVTEVEQRSGLDFFAALPDDEEQQLEGAENVEWVEAEF